MNPRRTVLGLLMIAVGTVPAGVLCQAIDGAAECAAGAAQFGPQDWKGAENQWQRTPSVAATQGDTVDSEERAARNAFWEKRLKIAPAGPPLVDYDYRPSVDPVSNKANNMVWVIGTFKSSRVYSTGSNTNHLYTEMNVLVDTVAFDPRAKSVDAGAPIDINLLGGCLRNLDGTIAESMVWPKRYSMQPGKRYLLALFLREAGLYTLWADWQIANGRILPSSPVDEVQVRQGTSELVGLSPDVAVRFIRKTLGTR